MNTLFGNPQKYGVVFGDAPESEPVSPAKPAEYRVTGYVTIEMRVREFVDAPVGATDREVIERVIEDLGLESDGTIVSEDLSVEREDDRGRVQSLDALRAQELRRLQDWNAGRPIKPEAQP
jgi:hypothetical protein